MIVNKMEYKTIENPGFGDMVVGDVVKWEINNNNYYLVTKILDNNTMEGRFIKNTVEEAFNSPKTEVDNSLMTFTKQNYPYVYKKTEPTLKGLIDS